MPPRDIEAEMRSPQPRVVTPGEEPRLPPSDAVILFDGKDMSQWTVRDGSPAGCKVQNGEMLCASGVGNIFSKPTFRSAQIHVEYAPPDMPARRQNGQIDPQVKGNSGVYLQGRYEIQILDSYNNPTYTDGSNGALYRVAAPMVNASRPPTEWQVFDIIFRAPKCEGGNLVSPGSVTELHNGVLTLENVSLRPRQTCEQGVGEPGPLMLQDHEPNGPPTTMKFRNIWFRRLEDQK
ncbi:MAG: DUF1080 domain-containing protein [Acidobacteriia bacterium]|nr:DUF1080 domain-containing protein [Terriglobia bacterium]